LDTFACLEYDANILMLINLTYLMNRLIVLQLVDRRLMSPLVLSKAIVCLVVIYWSLWISLAELSHSSFALVVSYVQVRICFLLPVMLMRAISGRSKLMRVGRRTGTLRLRASMDDILF
jgi:hypothetical protein